MKHRADLIWNKLARKINSNIFKPQVPAWTMRYVQNADFSTAGMSWKSRIRSSAILMIFLDETLRLKMRLAWLDFVFQRQAYQPIFISFTISKNRATWYSLMYSKTWLIGKESSPNYAIISSVLRQFPVPWMAMLSKPSKIEEKKWTMEEHFYQRPLNWNGVIKNCPLVKTKPSFCWIPIVIWRSLTLFSMIEMIEPKIQFFWNNFLQNSEAGRKSVSWINERLLKIWGQFVSMALHIFHTISTSWFLLTDVV